MAMNELVVGVDGSATSIAALRWAMGHASRTGLTVVAVHSWEYPFYGDITGASTGPPHQLVADGARALLTESLQKVEVPDGVDVVPEVIEGPAARVLLDRSRDAELLVVGARGRGGFLHLLLGSVASQCINHATVPVVVVPNAERDR